MQRISALTAFSSDKTAPPSGAIHNQAIRYFPAIDGLRGLAILFVLWYHAVFLFPEQAVVALQGRQAWFWKLAYGGWMGVDLFFVISGFLITSILLNTKSTSDQMLVFWLRRGLRILPLAMVYLMFLAFSCFAMADPFGLEFGHHDFLAYAGYFGNLHIMARGWQPLVVMVLWSLAVEEQFYLFWPLVVRQCTSRRLLIVCITIIGMTPGIRYVVDQTFGYPGTYVCTFCRMDALAIGGALAILWTNKRYQAELQLWSRRLLPVALALLTWTFVRGFGPSLPQGHPRYFTVWGYTWIALALAVVVVVSLDNRHLFASLLTNGVLRCVGKVSYGLYVWHCCTGVAIRNACAHLGWSWQLGWTTLVWMGASFGAAHVSWVLLERPALQLKRLFACQQSALLEKAETA